jgi:hypothetical protein
MDGAMHFAGSFVTAIYRVIPEERAVLEEVTLSAIVRKVTSYDHGYTGVLISPCPTRKETSYSDRRF